MVTGQSILNDSLDLTGILNVYSKMPKTERDKYLAKNDCIFFGERYVKPYDTKWNSECAPFHYEMIDYLENDDYVQIHVPYDHAKTTWISIVYPLWILVNNPNDNILLISATPKLVQKCLQVISWHLLNNTRLRKDFPYLRKDIEADKWTDTQIYLERTNKSKDPSVEVVGMGGSILGGKYKKIIGDDVCDRNNMNTVGLRDKAENWWLEDVHSRLTPDGSIANIGTLQNPDDLGVRLSRNEKYKYIHHKAIIDEDKGITLWPQRYPIATLQEKRAVIGTIRFERTYQNNIASFEGRLFHPEWLHYYNENDVKMSELIVYFGVDPDIAKMNVNLEKAKNCWFVIAVLGWHPISNLVYVLRTHYGIYAFPDQVRLIAEFDELYHPRKIAIENNAYQAALEQQAFLEGLPVVGIPSTQNKIARIESRSADFEIGRIRVMANQLELISEFINFPDDGYKNDVLDAIDMGCRIIPSKKRAAVVSGGVY